MTSWREVLARGTWAAVLGLLTPVYLLKLWWRGRAEPGYRQALLQRLGWVYGPAQPQRPIWVHAVSLGETKAAAALIAALRQQHPGVPLLLTHGTATGREAGLALLQPGDAQTWLPWDTPGATRRFMAHWRPQVGVLMETEIWPSLLHAAAQAQAPMVLANARLSERSARKGQRLALLLRPAARALHLALAQSEDDAQRLRAAGVDRVVVAGNLKYELQPDPAELALGGQWQAQWATAGRRVVVAANTRDGEEALLLAAWQAWLASLPEHHAAGMMLALVPRHPQRFDEVAALVQAQGRSLWRRSDWQGGALPEQALQAQVVVGDSLGEMARYYGMAQVSLLGGSFAPLGGHNLIESLACGCPMVLGPSTFNFAEATTLALAAGAAWQVADAPSAMQQVGRVLADPALRQQAQAAALAFTAQHTGAAARMAQQLGPLISAPAGR
ncbi:3-deoxy-D-manno-octulosonic acid transferase [Ideonella paludis]|uniref:3-deoxy-D-manno-octulosonic acid transferase n=1 Tax=Ideonella paludis TaxID=1233411 RepID=A0ABS5DXE3_9BURK|nr:3-deoxy-D-manno-octulosonic acid transferase [Ideonella paludis]MBQ0935808.1 3-deoxy-D-manno-octulosonic acid transferase [Ideonella paludis]